ncbi:MAG TPA: alkaline phosphatase PafA, partial [Segetibacter sp.]
FMKRFIVVILLVLGWNTASSQNKSTSANGSKTERPKLVVGIVVDQMRWDFLYRFYNLYSPKGGIRRMLDNGYSCENTFTPYAPTITAPGHATAYTGSVPAIHGITGNAWWDSQLNRSVYCVEDNTVKTVGNTSTAGEMSPRNMLTTTITDELRMSSNFKSKVVAVAIKDRGAILPAGHSANAAYWYDASKGNFITSTYYMNDLPEWVKNFNDRKVVDSLYELNWNLALKTKTYNEYATDDVKPYEGKPFGQDATGFPYNLAKFIGKDYSKISSTPHGNSLIFEMAKAALQNEQLGKSGATDFLAVSLSSPDYVGHSFGPNSWETLDTYIRLDESLGKFFDHLDATVGKGQYISFFTADHGVAHVPGFLKENKLPGGTFDDVLVMREMNTILKQKFGREGLIVSMYNYQVHLNNRIIDSLKLDRYGITTLITNYLQKQESVARVFEIQNLSVTTINSKQREMLANGYYPSRGGDIQIILKPGYIDGGPTGTTHGLWNPYDSHIPLVWYGWNIKPGKLHRETYMTDIAPTLAAMLQIQMPNGTVGTVIQEVVK